MAITTKSPLTGTITDGSVGGHIGAELKYEQTSASSVGQPVILIIFQKLLQKL